MRGRGWLIPFLLFLVMGIAGCGEKPAPELFSTGYVRQKEVEVYAGIVGTVTKVCFERGSHVKEGQVLLETDDTHLRLALEAASARRQRLLAQLEQYGKGTQPAPLIIDPAEMEKNKALLEMAQIGIEQARDTLDEKAELLRSGMIPVDSLPGVTEDINRARSALDDTLEVIQTTEQKLNEAVQPADGVREVLERELEESTIAERLAEYRVKQAKILAPVSGEISARHIEVGEVIFPERALFTISVPEEKWIDTYVAESGLGKIRRGSQVIIKCPEAFGDQHFTGTITWIADEAEFSPKSLQSGSPDSNLVFPVVIGLPPDTPLRAGMSVKISLMEEKGDRSN